MQRNAEPVRKFQLEIAELKKQFLVANETNQSLKIEIRKLQNEVTKKDKQIRQASIINKAISDKRVNSIHNLHEKNSQLQKEMAEKDRLIENLQNGSPTVVETRDNETSDDTTPRALKLPKHMVDVMVEELLHEVKCVTSDTRAVYQDLSREHLLSIIQTLKNDSILQDEKSTSWEENAQLPNNEESCTKTRSAISTLIKGILENGVVPSIDKLSDGLYTAWRYSKNFIFFIFIFIYIYQLLKLHFW